MANTLAYQLIPVQVRNLGGEPVGSTKLDRAIALINRGEARVVEFDESRIVRSAAGKALKLPKVIEMLRYILVPFIDTYEHFSPKGVLRRDNYTCNYCGTKKGQMTWDHIQPKSRGGEERSWLNSTTACLKCNSKKGNLTLEEAEAAFGMKLLRQPFVPVTRYFKSGKKPREKKKRKF